jgi:subtilisin family serine protease
LTRQEVIVFHRYLRVPGFVLLALCGAGCGGGGATSGDPDEVAAKRETVLVEVTSRARIAEVGAIAERLGWRWSVPGERHPSLRAARVLHMERGAGAVPAETLLEDLRQNSGVVTSERNARHSLLSRYGGTQSQVAIFDDMLSFSTMGTQPALDRIGALRAHAQATGRGIVVAVLDGGFDLRHEALAGRLAGPGYDALACDGDPEDRGNGRDDDGDGGIDDGAGHGTAVAGVVLATAPGALVLPIRVLDDEGNGTALSLSLGILYALDAGAQVLNISAGGQVVSKIVEDTLRDAARTDVLIVTSTGNSGINRVDYPASSRYVVPVAGLAPDGRVDPSSNYGREVELCAPSIDVIAPYPGGTKSYGRWRGTSLAAPFLAGAAALVLEDDPLLTPEAAGEVLLANLAPYGPMPSTYDGLLGNGVLDVSAVIR